MTSSGSGWESSQEYSVNARVPEGFILYPLYSKCDQASDLWVQLQLAAELEIDLQDIVDCDRNWLVDANAGKIQLISFDLFNNMLLL